MRKMAFMFIVLVCFVLSAFATDFNYIMADKEMALKNDNLLSYSTVSARGYVSFWVQKSSGSYYLLPEIIEKNIPVEFELKVYNSSQYSDFKTIELDNVQKLKTKMNFYSICSSTVKNSCKDYYFVVQIDLKGMVNSFCGGYFNEKDFLPFPVIFCSGYTQDLRMGLTLHRLKY